ncbi:MAG: Smr/MutS family protein [Porphyromonas sp.]|nr:Smr/MutS family protein [Porphyromonas sp.]
MASPLYPSDVEEKLGFIKTREEILERCSNEVSRHLAHNIKFSTDFKELSSQLSLVREMQTLTGSLGEAFPSTRYGDIKEALMAIRPEGTYLPIEKCIALKELLSASEEVQRFFEHYSKQEEEEHPIRIDGLLGIASQIMPVRNISKRLSLILDDEGHIPDNASPLLREIRKEIARIEVSVGKTIQSILAQAHAEGWVDKDHSITMRDGRLVLPVIPHAKRMVRGILHDESATGKTLFIEPEAVVEANNKLREKKSEEKREIVRILKEFTALVREHLPEIKSNSLALGVLDFIVAKTRWADKYKATVPLHLSASSGLQWKEARHPYLEHHLRQEGKSIVPLDIRLTKKERILVISGPNAGGKSVCLKTVGLLQYMLQCGLPIPMSEDSHAGIFRHIFLDIGDQQSLENDLSTYSSHLANMKHFILHAGAHSLLLIDEFGSGTEPVIGGAIAESILEHFIEKRCFGVITTHYTNIKDFCETQESAINGAMLFDRHKIQPLFKLSIGQPGSSFAIEISRKIGLPLEILNRATEKVGEEFVMQDQYLQSIMRDKKYWEEKRSDLKSKLNELEQEKRRWEERNEKLKLRQSELIKEAEKRAVKIIKDANSDIEKAIREIKESNADKSVTQSLRQDLSEKRKQLEARTQSSKKVSSPTPTFKPGDSVAVEGSAKTGEILEVRGKKAHIRLGQLSMEIALSKLKPSLKSPTKVQKSTSKIVLESGSESRLNFKPQIDLRGMRANEAMEALAYYIDDAYKINISPVRILHGTGTGALREMVRSFCASSHLVKSFRDEHADRGGTGITVVEL